MSEVNPMQHPRYVALMHAMQTGIKYRQELGLSKETEPKHLRVGVNTALVELGALVETLAEAGVIDLSAFTAKLLEKLEAEVAGMEREISEHLGAAVKLA